MAFLAREIYIGQTNNKINSDTTTEARVQSGRSRHKPIKRLPSAARYKIH